MSWHLDDRLRADYVSGRLDAVSAASVEQHLLACPSCRLALARDVPLPERHVDPVWLAIRDALEAPAPTFVERLATRLGLSRADARLLAAVPSLRVSWLAGVALASALALLAARFGTHGSVALFLLVAPLAPVVGVAWAYGPTADESHEVVAAAPYPALRLLLLRAAAVLVTSLPIVAVAAALLPVPAPLAVGWLLPSLAFVLVVLAASPWVALTTSSSVVCLLWFGLVMFAALGDPGAPVAPAWQPLYLAVAAVAAGALTLRSRGTASRERTR
jgi:hypothetical protein